jgi:hypothetical protein
MIKSRRRWTFYKRARGVLPAVAFLACATLAAAGGDSVSALWLVPAGLALEVGRQHYDAAGDYGADGVDDTRLARSTDQQDRPKRDARGENC